MSPDGELASFLGHLAELRRRIIFSLVALGAAATAAFVLYEPLVALLMRPFEALPPPAAGVPAAGAPGGAAPLLYVSTVAEGFLIRMKVALLGGLVLSLPVHVFHLVRFVLPGLTARERRVILAALLSSFALVVLSFWYGYYQLVPVSLRFLVGAGFVPPRVGVLLNYGRSVFAVLQFILITVCVFQLPVLLELLMVMRLLKRRALLRGSRYAIVLIFIVAAVVTPPDVVSQLGVALPLVALYFLTLLIARVFRFGEG